MIEVLRFILTLLVVYQITSIISESSFPLFKWLRTLPGWIGELFSCFLCVSVWIGFIISSKLFDPAYELGYVQYSWIWSGLIYSSLVWFIHLIEEKLS